MLQSKEPNVDLETSSLSTDESFLLNEDLYEENTFTTIEEEFYEPNHWSTVSDQPESPMFNYEYAQQYENQLRLTDYYYQVYLPYINQITLNDHQDDAYYKGNNIFKTNQYKYYCSKHQEDENYNYNFNYNKVYNNQLFI